MSMALEAVEADRNDTVGDNPFQVIASCRRPTLIGALTLPLVALSFLTIGLPTRIALVIFSGLIWLSCAMFAQWRRPAKISGNAETIEFTNSHLCWRTRWDNVTACAIEQGKLCFNFGEDIVEVDRGALKADRKVKNLGWGALTQWIAVDGTIYQFGQRVDEIAMDIAARGAQLAKQNASWDDYARSLDKHGIQALKQLRTELSAAKPSNPELLAIQKRLATYIDGLEESWKHLELYYRTGSIVEYGEYLEVEEDMLASLDLPLKDYTSHFEAMARTESLRARLERQFGSLFESYAAGGLMNDEFMSQVQSAVLAPWQKATVQFQQYVQKTASQEDEDIVLWTQAMAAQQQGWQDWVNGLGESDLATIEDGYSKHQAAAKQRATLLGPEQQSK